ncbi:T9SS sorting signal type C domain-containing protein, partial [Flavobacterium psychrophilum]|uniref:T9SS sorting signal type C domain-containing protein n=1 Tax=Flavobacterium psychrophilum TaxID=96345 RepID=UPI000B8E2D2F
TTWNGSTWSNGAPILSKATIINGNYTTAVSGSFSTCNLTVNPTFTFTISANTYVEIQENLTNNGIFKISNTGSLIQINDAGVNTGNISYERIASAKLQDYVYWSSPISGFNVNSISPSTPAYYHWIWNPTVANTNGGLGNWQNASATMTAGQGYIVRAPNGFSNASVQNWTATFNNGVPFNGVYKPIISRGSYTSGNYIGTNGEQISADDDNWNLLGNPYPSAISINSFLLANTQLDGFVRLWTHNTLPASTASPFYASFSSNYTGADYISINAAGATSGPGTLNVIGGGQGFFTLMLPGVATTSTALFNNAMRKKTLSNSQFYKTTDNHLTANEEIGEDIERNRIWIDLKNPTGETIRTLVAYVEGATLERDRMFDATTDYKSDQNLYSLIGNDIMTIQGRGLPFDVNDTVPMGIKVPTNGTYNIALAAVDGLFSKNAQKIYIEDKLLNTINDITAFPYQFTTNQGIINDRFVLRYTNQMLTNTDFKLNENTIAVFGSDNEIKINTSLEKIKNYTVCNVLGQTLAEKNNINTNQSVINTVLKSNQALIVKVTLANGQTIIKKIVF